MKDYIKLMRIKHYIKNGLIFLPLFFSQKLLNFNILKFNILGFISFSLMCSVIYILNDIKDIEKDRKHPKKKNRPLAANKISKKNAYILMVILFIISGIFNYFSSTNVNIKYTYILLGIYLFLNLLYSCGLKNVPLVDVAILASGFIIRILYGSVLTGVSISNWLYLTVMSMSFYLGLGKRRKELEKNNAKSRKVLDRYSISFLDKNMYLCMGLTIIFYSLWTIDPAIATTHNYLIWTVPVVLLICMLYSLDIEGTSYGDPVEVVLGNKYLVASIVIYLIFILFIFYGSSILNLIR